MLMRILPKFQTCAFLIRNFWRLRNVADIKPRKICDISYRGYKLTDADQVAEIYARLNDDAHFFGTKSYLYRLIGNRCLFVATQANKMEEEVVVGINMYYLNARDIRENTIHEGFIGVNPSMAGQGIASNMRKIAKEHFKASEFNGISTRISLSNIPSLKSAKKIGFSPIEEYVEASTGEGRYYMTCNFQKILY